MKISAKTDYACRAILELAEKWPNKNPVQIQAIATSQRIPMKFLTLILLNLKQLGYVESVRGKNGGYMLSKAPAKIVLSDIVKAFNGTNNKDLKEMAKNNIMGVIWQEVNDKLFSVLEDVNFADILERKRKKDNIVMFEI